jgi:hypothetical protein
MLLDEEKLEALRSWGERLRQTGGDESAAVGRAILMLVEEIDRLHIELWHARLQRSAEPVSADTISEAEDAPVTSTLQTRLRRVLRRESDSAAGERVEVTNTDTEPEKTTSAQAWLDALRRQK